MTSFAGDDENDIPALKPKEEAKEAKDRENAEMFRRAAEEDGTCDVASSNVQPTD